MLRIAARRLAWSVPILFSVSVLTFLLARLSPGDAARVVLGTNTDPVAYARIRRELGLDQSLFEQYTRWLGHALRGDLGSSLFTGEPVTAILNSRLAVSLSLIVGTTLACVTIGLAVGMFSAVRGGAWGRGVDAMALLGMAVPNYWLGLLLIAAFAVGLPWFPATGYVPFMESSGEWARSLVLPVVTLAVAGIATVASQTRGAMVDVLQREFIRALRANGMSTRSILFKHALRNAALPVVTVVGLLVAGLLGGTVLVEYVFALPGLGVLAVTATNQHDLPVIEGIVVYFTLIVIVVNLATDLLYAWLNPKVVTG
jgi:peptide/nickel transport system permease protein